MRIRLLVGDQLVDGYEPYADARDRFPAEPLAEEVEGTPMLYSSGTTGRPKGIKYKIKKEPIGAMPARDGHAHRDLRDDEPTACTCRPRRSTTRRRCYCMSTMRLGGTVICMEQFDPEDALRQIERHHITHSQWVPTMFVRMLKLPDDVRARTTCRRIRCAIHAAAPCPVEVKQRMIEWWGPIIEEYYSATEGMGATFINSEQWLAHPGSVGKTMLAPIHIVDEDGNDVPTGEIGTVYFEPAAGRPDSSTTRTRRRRRRRSTRTAGRASATWATSTTRATCTSPIAARS